MSNVATSLKSFPHCLPKRNATTIKRDFFGALLQWSPSRCYCLTAQKRLWLPQPLVHSHPCYATPDVLKVKQADIWLLSNQSDWVPLDRLEPVRAAAHTCWAAQNLMLFDHLLRSQLKHSAQNTGKSGVPANMGTASTNAIGTFAMSNHP